MGLGILTYIHSQLPLILYVLCILFCVLTIAKDRKIGFYYLLFLLPFTYSLVKIHKYPLGNQILDALLLSIVIATFLQYKGKIRSTNFTPILLHIVIVVFAFLVGFLFEGPYDMGDFHHYYRLELLKNYMTMPLLYWLTLGVLQEQHNDFHARTMVLFMLFVVLIVDWRFWDSFKWRSGGEHFSEDVRMNAFGSLGANHLGAFAVEYAAIAMGLLLYYKNIKARIFLLLMIAASIYVAFFTYSRGAYLAIGVLFIFFCFFQKKLIIPIIIIALMGSAAISLLPTSVVERMTMTKTESGEVESSAGSRLVLWAQGGEIFTKNPIIGIGYQMVPSYINYDGLRNLHNYILQVLVETGIIGFCIFNYLLYSIFRSGWRLYKRSSDSFHEGLGLGFCGCIIASIITNLFGDRWSFIQMQGYLWVFWAICDSIQTRLTQQPVQSNHSIKFQ